MQYVKMSNTEIEMLQHLSEGVCRIVNSYDIQGRSINVLAACNCPTGRQFIVYSPKIILVIEEDIIGYRIIEELLKESSEHEY